MRERGCTIFLEAVRGFLCDALAQVTECRQTTTTPRQHRDNTVPSTGAEDAGGARLGGAGQGRGVLSAGARGQVRATTVQQVAAGVRTHALDQSGHFLNIPRRGPGESSRAHRGPASVIRVPNGRQISSGARSVSVSQSSVGLVDFPPERPAATRGQCRWALCSPWQEAPRPGAKESPASASGRRPDPWGMGELGWGRGARAKRRRAGREGVSLVRGTRSQVFSGV